MKTYPWRFETDLPTFLATARAPLVGRDTGSTSTAISESEAAALSLLRWRINSRVPCTKKARTPFQWTFKTGKC
jgi:hypothetical protein